MAIANVHDVFGVQLTRADIAELSGLSIASVHERANRGMTVYQILSTPKIGNRIAPGEVFDRLTVVEESGRTAANKVTYLCRCECGNSKTILGAHLKDGRVRSCGCLKSEFARRIRKCDMCEVEGHTTVGCRRWRGRRSGALEALRVGPGIPEGKRVAHSIIVQCDCGTVKEVRSGSFQKGEIKSCGCGRGRGAQ